MKRYATFRGSYYYPWGGWRDLQGRYDTRTEAEAAIRAISDPDPNGEFAHIVDLETGDVTWLEHNWRSGSWEQLDEPLDQY